VSTYGSPPPIGISSLSAGLDPLGPSPFVNHVVTWHRLHHACPSCPLNFLILPPTLEANRYSLLTVRCVGTMLFPFLPNNSPHSLIMPVGCYFAPPCHHKHHSSPPLVFAGRSFFFFNFPYHVTSFLVEWFRAFCPRWTFPLTVSTSIIPIPRYFPHWVKVFFVSHSCEQCSFHRRVVVLFSIVFPPFSSIFMRLRSRVGFFSGPIFFLPLPSKLLRGVIRTAALPISRPHFTLL